MHERTQESGGGVKGPEAMLGWGEGEEGGDLVENKSFQDLVWDAK